MTDSGSSENAKHKRMPVKTIFSHIIFQLQKTKNNEKILKESRERTRKTTYRGTIKRITVEFSQGTIQARGDKWNIEGGIKKISI